MKTLWVVVNSFTTAETWVYGLLATFVLGVIGNWIIQRISHGLSIARERWSILRAAVQKYKSAFATEIAAVNNSLYTMDTFPIAFERHEAAVNTVRPILPERYQRKLQEAWDEYQGKGSGLDGKDFVAACNMSLYSADQELFKKLKYRFKVLHNCLDKLK